MWIEGDSRAGCSKLARPYSLWGLLHSTRYWLVALTTPPAGSAVFTIVNGYYEADVGGYQDSTQEGLNKLRALGVTIVALIPRKQKENEWKTIIH